MKLVELNQLFTDIKALRLNNPCSLNAMSEQMASEFSSAVQELQQDHTLRGVVITGAGRAFSAGGDLKMLQAKTKLSLQENKTRMLDFYDAFLSLRKLEVPVVALINGIAVGAGLCLACACDVRICSQDARLGFSFGRLGLHPGMGATYLLPRLVGPAKAAELFFAGTSIDATQAAAIGLVNHVVASSELLNVAESFFTNVSNSGKLATTQLVKTLRGDDAQLRKALVREANCQAENYASEEFAVLLQNAIDKSKRSD